ncbi:MAG: OmpA family protein [Ignavibacteriales bacterium]|nr:hypothetical protein [Ignavibacteriaceae bacterium]QOJ27806.1 MAG: OmpA family protein [Ignavibacteriales bacterium]
MGKHTQLFAFLFLIAFTLQAQNYENGWSLGGGMTSPRYMSDVTTEFWDFGGHIFVQRDFDPTNSLRFVVEFIEFRAQDSPVENFSTFFGFEYLFRFKTSDKFGVYAGVGGYGYVQDMKGSAIKKDGISYMDVSASFLIGGQYFLNDEFEIHAQVKQSTLSTDKFDGVKGPVGGFFGGTLDSYISTAIGINYYWERGKPVVPQLPSGLVKAEIDYEKIQKMIDAAQKPGTEVDYSKFNVDYDRIEEMVDRKLKGMKNDPTVIYQSGDNAPKQLVSINFDSNSSTLRSDAYVLLAQNALVLLSNPDMKVEIGGYTDGRGNSGSNSKLSQERADAVKKYLVSKGISASRLTVKAYGSANPISDNDTESGRALNRRVELKIIK